MSRISTLNDLLSQYDRIAICGGPGTGKSTIANWCVKDRAIIATDDYRHLEWADVPSAVAEACSLHSKFCVEGVQVARTLRRGLQVDAVLYLDVCMAPERRRASMEKAIDTVFREFRQLNRTIPVYSPDRISPPIVPGHVSVPESVSPRYGRS
jgi:hypothetical protein